MEGEDERSPEEELVSLDNYTSMETRPLNRQGSVDEGSPRSLAACENEGIDPSFLLYRPLEAFAAPGKPRALQQQEFEKHEALRTSTFVCKHHLDILLRLKQDRLEEQKRLEQKARRTGTSRTKRKTTPKQTSSASGSPEVREDVMPQLRQQYQLLKKVRKSTKCFSNSRTHRRRRNVTPPVFTSPSTRPRSRPSWCATRRTRTPKTAQGASPSSARSICSANCSGKQKSSTSRSVGSRRVSALRRPERARTSGCCGKSTRKSKPEERLYAPGAGCE